MANHVPTHCMIFWLNLEYCNTILSMFYKASPSDFAWIVYACKFTIYQTVKVDYQM